MVLYSSQNEAFLGLLLAVLSNPKAVILLYTSDIHGLLPIHYLAQITDIIPDHSKVANAIIDATGNINILTCTTRGQLTKMQSDIVIETGDMTKEETLFQLAFKHKNVNLIKYIKGKGAVFNK